MHRICFALLTLALGFPVHADASESALSYQQVALFPADRSCIQVANWNHERAERERAAEHAG